ncbi:MAG: beta-N-acetylhexosaminidase [Candidatus Berkiellales bacterium]
MVMVPKHLGPIIFDLEGLTLSPEEKEILMHPLIGGVIFFSRNFENPQQLMECVQAISQLRPDLLLSVDQEGGRVQRFMNGMTRLPKLRMLGDLFDSGRFSLPEIIRLSEQFGQLMALEVRSLGIDLSFAPVLDLDLGKSEVIGDRAFHKDPTIVSTLATAYITGMAQAGMQAVGKHFPGHGSVSLDSHLALPSDERRFAEITADLTPFVRLIEKQIPGLMPAHIVYPQIDPLPVGFSPYWLQTVLRQKLGFRGAIVSDDLSMKGASGMGDDIERVKQALKAGCDFVLMCNNRKGVIAALDAGMMDNKESHPRRQHLLAKGVVPSWEDLIKTAAWNEARAALDNFSEPS